MSDISLEQLQTLLTQLGLQANPGGAIYVPTNTLAPVPSQTITNTTQKVAAPGTPSTQSGSLVPSPTISQSLVGTPVGYQFAFNQVVLSKFAPTTIAVYAIYRGLVNNFRSSSQIQTIPPNPALVGAVVVTDDVNTASNLEYFYWVVAVDSLGNQSAPTPAQTGAVIGSVGSIPSALSTAFKVVTTTSSVTLSTSPSAYFLRSDGSKTMIGQTSQAVTGLSQGNNLFFFPYWRESDQSLQFVNAADINIPLITGFTSAMASQQYVKTTTVGSLPTAFSVEIWVKTLGFAGALFDYSAPQTAGTTTASVLQGQVTSAGEIEVSVHNGSAWTTVTTSGATIIDTTWHHVVFTYASGVGTIYVDGVNTSDGSTFWVNNSMGTIATTSGSWHFGFVGGLAGATVTSNLFNQSTMSHAAVYSTALAAADALSHLQSFADNGETLYLAELNYSGAVSLWKFNETSGTVAADSIGSNTGTYVNSPSFNHVTAVVTVLGTPAIAWPYNYLPAIQQQGLRNRVPLANGGIKGSTTVPMTTAGGGSSNGGTIPQRGGGCFTGETLVLTKRGSVRIDEIKIGDLCLTAKGNWLPVQAVCYHGPAKRELYKLPGGGWVTYDHKIIHEGEWIKAGKVFETHCEINEPIYTLTMASREPVSMSLNPFTERSFTLGNGIIVTNYILNKDFGD